MDRELPVSVWPEWKIVEKIGEGSFGKVYKAQRMERDKAFYSAIKIITIPSNQSELKSLQSELGSEQSVKEYFQNLVEECIQEVSTMEYFRGNSHVVAVEDYKVVEYLDTVGWDIYIRMEYLTSFLEYCAGKQMDETEVIQLGIDLCKALEYCQKLNIIHRDIKPENIFVSRFGEFKLGDFGIARELERTMGTLSKKGTYSYMAPEMYRGEKYDSRVDIYSLGIMLYKLRNCNRLPFLSLEKQLITYRDKENALTKRMSGEALPVPADAGTGLAQVILKACAFHCEDRYSSAAEFREALERLKYNSSVIMQAHGQIRQKADQQDISSQRKPAPIHEQSGQKPARQDISSQRKSDKIYEQSGQKPVWQSISSQRKPDKIHEQGGPKPARQSIAGQHKSGQTYEQNRQKTTQQRAIGQEKAEQPQNIPARRKKKKQPDNKPLIFMVITLTIAVIVLTFLLFRILLQKQTIKEENAEPAGIVQAMTDLSDESEKEGLAEELAVIRDHATEISNDLETPYQWIGTEKDGKISYFNTDGEIMKVLIYPNASKDGVYEEYYYWDGKLFFAYIWADNSIVSSLDDGEVRADYYYYKDGKLIRWIDNSNVCHDYETDNEEYNTRGEKYLKRSIEYTEEFVQENGGEDDGLSD